VPKILDGIELGRIGRQLYQRDVGGNLQCFGRVEAAWSQISTAYTGSELLCELARN
jgi:hypothetical protein